MARTGDRQAIESALRAAVPAALHPYVADVARVLADLVAGRPPGETQPVAPPGWEELARALAGKSLVQFAGAGPRAFHVQTEGAVPIDQSRKVIDFGSGNQLGSISFRDVAETIIQINLAGPAPPPIRPVPFLVPALPDHFVPRPQITQALRLRLLRGTGERGPAAVSAVHGLGGGGKTTLAIALCRDAEVRAAFPDGILWAALGQQPDLLAVLGSWIQELGDPGFRPTTVEVAAVHLRGLVGGRALLLVLDDTWEAAHARPLLVGGRCRGLVTTRRLTVADELGADLYELGVMSPDESLELLRGWLARASPLEGREQEEALQVAEAVGHLPLALELAAARVRRGVSWADLGRALREEEARLATIEDPLQSRKQDGRLQASLTLSLKILRAQDEDAWKAFRWLGVLPEEVALTAPMAAALWGIGDEQADQTLEVLWGEALLLPPTRVAAGDRTWRLYRLHDLVRDMARRVLTAPLQPARQEGLSGLGLSLPQARERLVRSEFFVRMADGLGPLAALAATRRIAEELAGDGRAHWETFRECAYRHCALTERLRGKAGMLEWMIEQGDVDGALQFIRHDADPFRRGVLQMLIAQLVRGRGDGRRAGELAGTGARLVRAQVAEVEDALPGYSRATTHLAYTLALQATGSGPPPAVPLDPQLEGTPSRGTGAGTRAGVPRLWWVLGFLNRHARLLAGVAFGVLLTVAMWAVIAEETGPRYVVVRALAQGLYYGFGIAGLACLLVWLALVPLLLLLDLPLVARKLAARMTGLADQADGEGEAGRHEILRAAVRFASWWQARSIPPWDRTRSFPPSWEEALARVVTHGFASLQEDVRSGAAIALDVAALGELPTRAVIAQLKQLHAAPKEAILREIVVAYRPWRTNSARTLRIVAETVTEQSDPALLLDLLTEFAPEQSELKQTGKDRKGLTADVLGRVPPSYLGRVLRESLVRDGVAQSATLLSLPTRWLRRLRVRWLGWQRFTFVVLFGLPLVMLLVAVALAMLMVAPIILPGLRRRDPLGVTGLAQEGSVAERRRRLAELLRRLDRPVFPDGPPPGQMWVLAPVTKRRLRDVVLAQAVLRGDAETLGLLATKPLFARVLRRLIRAAVVSQSQIVLAVMGDRRLLDAALAARPTAGRKRPAQAAPEADDDRELRRRLPLEPAWLNLLLVITLGSLGTLLYFQAVAATASGALRHWLRTCVLWEALGICLLFPILEHVLPRGYHPVSPGPAGRPGPLPHRLARWVAAKAANLLTSLLLAAGFLSPVAVFLWHSHLVETAPRADPPLPRPAPGLDGLLFLAVPYVLTCLLVPELIARCRGAHVLYPPRGRLWWERLKAAVLAVACWLLLVGLTRLVT